MAARKPKKHVKRRAKKPPVQDIYADVAAKLGVPRKMAKESVLGALYSSYGRGVSHNAKLIPGVCHGGSVHGHQAMWDPDLHDPVQWPVGMGKTLPPYGNSSEYVPPSQDNETYYPAPPWCQKIAAGMKSGDLLDVNGVLYRVNKQEKFERVDTVAPDDHALWWAVPIGVVIVVMLGLQYFLGV